MQACPTTLTSPRPLSNSWIHLHTSQERIIPWEAALKGGETRKGARRRRKEERSGTDSPRFPSSFFLRLAPFPLSPSFIPRFNAATQASVSNSKVFQVIFYSICEQYLLFYKVFTRSICAKSNSIILECTLNMAKRRKNRQTRSKETGHGS